MHLVFLNVAVGDDGKTSTFESHDLYRNKMLLGALLRCELGKELRLLGLELEAERSWFEVKGVNPGLCNHWSSRRHEIVQALEAEGLSGAKAAEIATLATRKGKQDITERELQARWRAEAREFGWTEEHARALFERVFLHVSELDVRKLRNSSCERMTHERSAFDRWEMVRVVAEQSQRLGIGMDAAIATADSILGDKQLVVSLGVLEGQERFTTVANHHLEAALLNWVDRLAESAWREPSAACIKLAISRVEDRREYSLLPEQRRALEHAVSGEAALRVILGFAGTGKTAFMEALRHSYELVGATVIGVSTTGKAAKGLESESGIKSFTIASALRKLSRGTITLDARTVLVVDEAGMASTDHLRDLLAHAEGAGSKIVLVGGLGQIQPFGAGSALHHIASRVGAYELLTVIRQRAEWARKAVRDFALGKNDEAFAAFSERGLLFLQPTHRRSIDRLVADWMKDELPAKDKLVIVNTNQEAELINRMIQARLVLAGRLQGGSAKQGSNLFREGDRVLFTRNDSWFGLVNGDIGSVVGFSEDNGFMRVLKNDGNSVGVPLDEYRDVKLGYAATAHRLQGATVERAYALFGPMQDRELTYVQASRSRGDTRLYISKDLTGDTMKEVVQRTSRSHAKCLAADVRAQIEIEEIRNSIDETIAR